MIALTKVAKYAVLKGVRTFGLENKRHDVKNVEQKFPTGNT